MNLELFSLAGKTAVVTGCNRGIGIGIAEGLARAGADIVGVFRKDAGAARDVVENQGRTFYPLSADLKDRDSVRGLVDAAVEAGGTLDILVNNAGTQLRADSIDFPEDYWDEVLDVNLRSVFFLSQAFARHVVSKNRRGKIINIASMLSFQGGIRVPAYTAAKHGVAGVTKILANEWASKGINVNAIAPGYVITNNTAALREDTKRSAEIMARIPAARWAQPEDMAGAAVFLASGAADYVHGHVLAVDGGWLCR